MGHDGHLSRRRLLSLICTLAAWPVAARRALAAADPKRTFEVETIGRQYGSQTASVRLAHYRVHATISILGIPLFSKQDVGGAVLQVEQYHAGHATTVALQFCGGSLPGRLHGFNRFGMCQEAVHADTGRVVESAYLSFMTASPEKNMAQARQSFTTAAANLSFSASHGHSTSDGYSTVIDHVTMPGPHTWFDCRQIADGFRATLSPASPRKHNGGALPTFLYAVRNASLNDAAQQTEFLQAGKVFRLSAAWGEKKSNQQLFNGHIHEEDGREASQFRLLFDRSDPEALPLNIEFRPKSFLTLRFQRAEAQSAPAIRPLLREES